MRVVVLMVTSVRWVGIAGGTRGLVIKTVRQSPGQSSRV